MIEIEIKEFPIGGIDLPERKNLTCNKKIQNMVEPERVAVPLSQHIGASSRPLVKEGQKVIKGEKIGEADGSVSLPIHASISGMITGLKMVNLTDGSEVEAVVIEKKGNFDSTEYEEKLQDIELKTKITPQIIRERVRNAGIAGMGGACFPAHVKLKPPEDKSIDTVLINGAECEPYITVDHRLMLEYPGRIMNGLELIRKTVGAQKGIIACEVNKPDALETLYNKVQDWELLDVVPLETRYPHGAEKHLIKAVLDREVPLRGLPHDVGVIVNNVQTAVAISDAVEKGKNLISRVVSVSGPALSRPSNLRVPLGTSVKDVIEYCGGPSIPNYHAIIGGPMTGRRIEDLNIPVVKGTSGIVLLPPEEYSDKKNRVCIRCGKCVEVCPMYLSPNMLVSYIKGELYKKAEKSGVLDCIECGACAFVCPSKRPLLNWICEGKEKIN